MTAEYQQLLQSLERATSRLADVRPRDAAEVQQAVEERARAIAAMAGWIAAERQASRPVRPELVSQLTRDLELGAGILVRMAVDRETTRLNLAKLGRELQMLRGLNNSSPTKSRTIDFQA